MTDFKDQINKILEELIIIASLKEHDKLKKVGERFVRDPWSYFRWGSRKYAGDSCEITTKYLENLYSRVHHIRETICSSIHLHKPTLAGKQKLTFGDDENYRIYKNWIDQLSEWIEKSIDGLKCLKLTYPHIPTFVNLIQISKTEVDEIHRICVPIEAAYKNIKVMLQLASEERETPPETKTEINAMSPASPSSANLSNSMDN